MILPCGEGNIMILSCGTIRGLQDTNQLKHPKQGSLEYNELVLYVATALVHCILHTALLGVYQL